jgi:hypothetical protein
LAAIGTLFYAFIIVLFQALSPFHAITKTWVTFTCLLLAVGSHLLWGKHRNLSADSAPLTTWIRDGLNSRWAALLVICGFFVLLSFSRALLMPPLAWDCLTYHLTFAALWIKTGTLLLFKAPDQIITCAHLPINGEIFASWLLLPFRTDLLVNTMNFPIAFLGGLSCYAIGRELGLTRKEASFIPPLICFAPVLYSQITTGYVDIAVFAFSSTAVLFTLRYLQGKCLSDCLLAFVATGILIGIKFTGIPVAGIIFIAITIKTMSIGNYSGFFKKLSLIILGLSILCIFGGRQYILNSIEAGNPLYPFPLKVFNQEVTEGWSKFGEIEEWLIENEKEFNWDKFGFFEKEYRKFCYLPLTAGPKFLLFFILALISLFARPRHVPRSIWYFLSLLWLVPVGLFYADNSANVARRGPWIDGTTRYIAHSIVLFTIQGLVFIKYISNYFKKIDFLLVAFIAWDLLYINKTHAGEVTVAYPLLILFTLLLLLLFKITRDKLHLLVPREKAYLTPTGLSGLRSIPKRYWLVSLLGFILLIGGLYFLQSYRDSTRYRYFSDHTDLHDFPRTLVNGWEFLDTPDEKKTIAMTIGWQPPGHKWFFYPLLGKHLQNDIVYLSAQHKWEVPTWVDRALLRGNSRAVWLHNIKRKKVDYILAVKPWPAELSWMLNEQDTFQLVFSENDYKIFKYRGET